MEKHIEIANRLIEDLSLDYVPLHDIIREFSGFEKSIPTESDFLDSIDLLEYLFANYNIKYYEGPGTKKNTLTAKQLLEYLKKEWYAGNYKLINYSIWFEIGNE
jgi:hypothetical protein